MATPTDAPICPLPQRSLCSLGARPRGLVTMSYQRKLPDVLNVEQAARLLEIAPGIQVRGLRPRDGG